MKCRVIWIDDQRDPNMIIPTMGRRFFHHLPEGFIHFMQTSNDPVDVVWLKSYDEWFDWMNNTWMADKDNPKIINCFCLDHDLGCYDNITKEEYTGVNVAINICDMVDDYNLRMPFYECHSSNPAGKENILSVFKTYEEYIR